MNATTPPEILEEEERRAPMRLAACRAELRSRPCSPIAVETRLRDSSASGVAGRATPAHPSGARGLSCRTTLAYKHARCSSAAGAT